MQISVVVRAYNDVATVKRALASILDQNLPADCFEIIIVEDASTDGTKDIVEEYAIFHNVAVVHTKPENKSAHHPHIDAANLGFNIAQGKYVMLFDADDIMMPYCLSVLSEALDHRHDCAYAYGDYYEQIENSASKRVCVENIWQILPGNVMFRRDQFAKAGFFHKVFFADHDLFLQTVEVWCGAYVPTPVFIYSHSKESMTSNPDRVRRGLEELRERHPGKEALIDKIRSYHF